VIILDTDPLTIIQRGEGDDYRRLAERLNAAGDEPVCATIISFEEQMRGWLAWIAKAHELERQVIGYARLHALLEDFQTRPVLAFDSLAAGEYQRLKDTRIRIGTMDLKIAAVALAHDALLLSRNLSDFGKVPGLKVEDWTKTNNH
jgi:tRNA(fMet)-specific endonuclease VapC